LSSQKIKEKIRNWFISPEENASGKEKLNIKAIGIAMAVVAVAILVLSFALSYWEDRKQVAKGSPFQNANAKQEQAPPPANGNSNPTSDPEEGMFLKMAGSSRSVPSRGGGAQAAAKNHNANQVIPRGANGSNPDSDLPTGYGIAVKLVNSIQSGEASTPVIAEVLEDVTSQSDLAIPKGTRVIGQASVDDSARRIQVHFQTLVYPEGEQHSVQGLALMPDGSAGLTGDYHSGSGVRQFGRFLGTFIGGMAQGMTEKQSAGLMGAYDVGSVKNGLLTGVSQSATDQTRMLTDDLSNTKPTMTLPSGQNFILYLEKGYQP
jgi:type IV secretory pathway VirB10-like protein